MKISTRGRYALRMMLDIAIHNQNGPVRIRDIASRQKLSVKYLEQIVSVLTKAGMLNSSRGPQGGYNLSKKPDEYLIGDILRLTEGGFSPVSCLEGNYNCLMKDECVTLRLWKELDDAIKGVIDKYTLENLVEWQKESSGDYII